MVGQKEEIRFGAQQKIPIHKIHPENERLSVLLESRQQLAVYLEGRRTVRCGFDDTRQNFRQLAHFGE